MHVLLLNNRTIGFQTIAETGAHATFRFANNFGVKYDDYGLPVSGYHCLFGLTTLNLFAYKSYSSHPNSASFLLMLNPAEVSVIGINYVYVGKVQLQVACFGWK